MPADNNPRRGIVVVGIGSPNDMHPIKYENNMSEIGFNKADLAIPVVKPPDRSGATSSAGTTPGKAEHSVIVGRPPDKTGHPVIANKAMHSFIVNMAMRAVVANKAPNKPPCATFVDKPPATARTSAHAGGIVPCAVSG